MRSSNCPRYLVPATTEAISSITTRLSNKIRDTFFLNDTQCQSLYNSRLADTRLTNQHRVVFSYDDSISAPSVLSHAHALQPDRACLLLPHVSCPYRSYQDRVSLEDFFDAVCAEEAAPCPALREGWDIFMSSSSSSSSSGNPIPAFGLVDCIVSCSNTD